MLQIIVSYFKNLNKMDIIQRLILTLDINKIDPLPLINLCLEMHFFKALIYICTMYNEDYITPLIKIFGLLDSSKEEETKNYGLRFIL